MRALYKIREDMQAVLNPPLADENGTEEVIMSADEIRTRLTPLEIEFDDKLENCLAYLKNLRAEEEALGAEIKRLTARKKAAQNRAESLKAYTLVEIELTQRTGVSVGPHKARIAKSQNGVIVLDETEVPDEFVKVERKPKKADILKWYKATGEILPGIDIETGRVHLRVL